MMRLKNPELLTDKCLINGIWLGAKNGEAINVTNPANGEILGKVPNMGKEETAQAIKAASAAFIKWKDKPRRIFLGFVLFLSDRKSSG